MIWIFWKLMHFHVNFQISFVDLFAHVQGLSERWAQGARSWSPLLFSGATEERTPFSWKERKVGARSGKLWAICALLCAPFGLNIKKFVQNWHKFYAFQNYFWFVGIYLNYKLETIWASSHKEQLSFYFQWNLAFLYSHERSVTGARSFFRSGVSERAPFISEERFEERAQ